MGGTERSQIFSEGDVRNGTLAFFRRAMGGTERSQFFSEGDGRNGTLAVFSEDDGMQKSSPGATARGAISNTFVGADRSI